MANAIIKNSAEIQPVIIPYNMLFRIFEKAIEGPGMKKHKKFDNYSQMEEIVSQLISYSLNVPPQSCTSLFSLNQRRTGEDSQCNWFRILENVKVIDIYNKANSMGKMCYLPKNFDNEDERNQPFFIQQATGLAFVLELLYKSRRRTMMLDNPKIYSYYYYFRCNFLTTLLNQSVENGQEILLSFDATDYKLKKEDFPLLGKKPFGVENWSNIINISDAEKTSTKFKETSGFAIAKNISHSFTTTNASIITLEESIEKKRTLALSLEQRLTKCRKEMADEIHQLECYKKKLQQISEVVGEGIESYFDKHAAEISEEMMTTDPEQTQNLIETQKINFMRSIQIVNETNDVCSDASSNNSSSNIDFRHRLKIRPFASETVTSPIDPDYTEAMEIENVAKL